MSDAYDPDLIALAQQTAEEQGIEEFMQKGVYCMVSGPTYESVTEGRALRTLGADTVGEWQLVSAVRVRVIKSIYNRLYDIYVDVVYIIYAIRSAII